MSAPDDGAVVELEPPDSAVETAALSAVPELLVMSVLAAVVEMALRSKRRQADLEASLRRAGIGASRAQVLDALDRLCTEGWADGVVELHDGGVLLSVTALGLEVLGRHRLM
jgi:DNA-binding PadR family transcriptional regulator